MKTKRTTPVLLLAVLIVGSFLLPAANAEDVATIYETARASFAETAPLIPGYNAAYPFAAVAQASAGAAQSQAAIVSGSFAATAPAIPGYNAGYPSLTVVLAQD